MAELAEKFKSEGRFEDRPEGFTKQESGKLHEIDKKVEEDSANLKLAFKMALRLSKSVQTFRFVDTFRKMVVKPVQNPICMIDGERRMINDLWNKLTPNDAFEMAIEWASFFATALREAGKTMLETQSVLDTQAKEE